MDLDMNRFDVSRWLVVSELRKSCRDAVMEFHKTARHNAKDCRDLCFSNNAHAGHASTSQTEHCRLLLVTMFTPH